MSKERLWLPRWHNKKSTCNAGDLGGVDSIPGVKKIPWRRKWQPSVFSPGKSCGKRGLAGYSPCGPKELDMMRG